MEVRDATAVDASAIRQFRCAQSNAVWDTEVEEYARSALEWRAEDPERRVKVIIDDDGALLGLVAYEPIDPDDVRDGFFVAFGALVLAAQGRGLGGTVFGLLLNELALEAPGARVVWRVDPHNHRSLRMSERLGYEGLSLAEAKPYLTFVAFLP